MTTIFNDIKYAFRQLWKSPGFTAVAVISLALGIGANTAIFSMINSALLQPLPYAHAEQLVDVAELTPQGSRNAVSGGAFKDWHDHSSKFAHLAVWGGMWGNLTGMGTPERVTGLRVSAEFLSVLGVAPMIGRGFEPNETAPGGNNHVILLTHSFWQGRYGGNEGVVGKVISLDQVPYTIIGVLPPNTPLLQEDLRTDAQFLVPEVIDAPGMSWAWGRDRHFRRVIGRLRPGVTVSEAETELRGIKQQLAAEYPPEMDKWSVSVIPLQNRIVGDTHPMFVLLFGAVALVLLIACANVSNLLLARSNARSREMAVRIALGAHSWRIFRQMLTESLLLALSGGALGLLLATFGIRLLACRVVESLPQVLHPRLDTHVLVFSILVACGCGVLFGILPAWHVAKADVNRALKETERGSASRSKRRSQSFLVASEFAFTLVLLIGLGLFLRSFVHLLKTDPGFNPKQTLAFDLSLPWAKYPRGEDSLRFTKDLIGRIRALPAVESVGAISTLPLSGADRGEAIRRTDKPEPPEKYWAGVDGVSGNYFSTMGIPLLRGRVITEADNIPTSPPVLVIDSSIARDLYPNEDPIGQHLDLLGKSCEIVGIVTPVRQRNIENDPRPRVYGAQAHFPTSPSIVIRTILSPLALVETIRKTILEADPDQPIANVRTLEQALHKELTPRRTMLALLGVFAMVAVGLASIGIYGVVSYTIGQRERELCIRFALGAQRRDIIRLVVKGGMKLSIIGIVLGLIIALALSHLLASLLFEVKTYDPMIFIGSVCLLGIVAVLSVYFPARRAAKIDPMEALRYE